MQAKPLQNVFYVGPYDGLATFVRRKRRAPIRLVGANTTALRYVDESPKRFGKRSDFVTLQCNSPSPTARSTSRLVS